MLYSGDKKTFFLIPLIFLSSCDIVKLWLCKFQIHILFSFTVYQVIYTMFFFPHKICSEIVGIWHKKKKKEISNSKKLIGIYCQTIKKLQCLHNIRLIFRHPIFKGLFAFKKLSIDRLQLYTVVKLFNHLNPFFPSFCYCPIKLSNSEALITL